MNGKNSEDFMSGEKQALVVMLELNFLSQLLANHTDNPPAGKQEKCWNHSTENCEHTKMSDFPFLVRLPSCRRSVGLSDQKKKCGMNVCVR